jgi:exopolyphosphatase/guanosine-5'-triphosphate,3'-diphosphate pyrophosphatase
VRLGVLDIGSNTVHLLVVDARVGGAPSPAASHKRELRLAEHLLDDGTMSRTGIDALISMIDSSKTFAEDAGCARVLPFVTSALREATNCDEVVRECLAATGVQLQVMSGFDEARATFLAARRWFGWSAGALSVFDIGGGSLEIAAGRDEEAEVTLSVPIGAGRMARQFGSTEVSEIRRYARAEIGSVIGDLLRRGPYDRAVATSKTFRTLGRITGAAPAGDGIYVRRVLSREKLAVAVEGIAEMPVEARSQLPGVSAGRAAQVLAGAVVAEAVMDLAGLTELELCPWALREGIILNYLDHLDYFPDAGLKARRIGTRMKLVEPIADDVH